MNQQLINPFLGIDGRHLKFETKVDWKPGQGDLPFGGLSSFASGRKGDSCELLNAYLSGESLAYQLIHFFSFDLWILDLWPHLPGYDVLKLLDMQFADICGRNSSKDMDIQKWAMAPGMLWAAKRFGIEEIANADCMLNNESRHHFQCFELMQGVERFCACKASNNAETFILAPWCKRCTQEDKKFSPSIWWNMIYCIYIIMHRHGQRECWCNSQHK